MSSLFATAHNRCGADIMRAGLALGFEWHIESAFPPAAPGTALMEVIAHRDREMFDVLLEHGADVSAVDPSGLNPLRRAAVDTNDIYFARRLLDTGAHLEPLDPSTVSAFISWWVPATSKSQTFCSSAAQTVTGCCPTLRQRLHLSSGPRSSARCSDCTRVTLPGASSTYSSGQAGPAPPRAARPVPQSWTAYRLQASRVTHLCTTLTVPVMTENLDDNQIMRLMVSHALDKYHPCRPRQQHGRPAPLHRARDGDGARQSGRC
jgi:hypothetical protein